MSKKKNTLKDLDEFLKQQAATIVAPAKLSDKIEAAQEEITESREAGISLEKIILDLESLSQQNGKSFRQQIYDFIVKSVESQKQFQAEDAMLINTALYLKGGDHWKEVIRQYWKKAGTIR